MSCAMYRLAPSAHMGHGFEALPCLFLLPFATAALTTRINSISTFFFSFGELFVEQKTTEPRLKRRNEYSAGNPNASRALVQLWDDARTAPEREATRGRRGGYPPADRAL